MSAAPVETQILEALRTLSTTRQEEVLDFVLFLRAQEERTHIRDERSIVLAEMRAAFADVAPDEIQRQVARALSEVREEYRSGTSGQE